jgi:DNA-directed RNA polymerase specialized sigma24 family protein
MTPIELAQETFTRLYTELERLAGWHFRSLSPIDREEAVQNTLALCWKAFHVLALEGRGGEPLLRSCLWYAVRQSRSGRTVLRAGNRRAKDVLDAARTGGVQFESLDPEVISADVRPVLEQVAFRIDLPQFLESLSDRQRSIALDLMEGMGTGECAHRHGISAGRVSQTRTRVMELYEEFTAN